MPGTEPCPDCGGDLDSRPPRNDYGIPVSGRPVFYCPDCGEQKDRSVDTGGAQ